MVLNVEVNVKLYSFVHVEQGIFNDNLIVRIRINTGLCVSWRFANCRFYKNYFRVTWHDGSNTFLLTAKRYSNVKV